MVQILLGIEALGVLVGLYVTIVFWSIAAGPTIELGATGRRNDLVPALVASGFTVAAVTALIVTWRHFRQSRDLYGSPTTP